MTPISAGEVEALQQELDAVARGLARGLITVAMLQRRLEGLSAHLAKVEAQGVVKDFAGVHVRLD